MIRTSFDYPPIPTRDSDWSATLSSYEPGHPIGRAPTEADAFNDLLSLLEDDTPPILPLVPAYGKDYASEVEVRSAWAKGGLFASEDGAYLSVLDIPALREQGVQFLAIRFRTRVCVIKVPQ